MKQLTVKDFIGNSVSFDEGGAGYIWGHKDGGIQMVAEIRGWGAIQNLFKRKDGSIDFESAAKFQDELGHFISDAINEKINESKDQEMNGLIEIHHEQCKELELEIQSLKEELQDAMIEFTKMHVEAAIKECIESAPSGSSTDTVSYEDVVECLKDCYPLNKIK